MPIIHFDSVSKYFSEDAFAVKDVTFVVEPGELVFITGPSGSGKTTLMRLLTREYTPTAGEIFFRETTISTLKSGNVHNHRRKIGVVFQDYQLVPEMNVWENIALPLYVMGKKEEEVEQRVTDLLNLIKLPEKSDQFPSQLSGGEAQRVSIARALAVGPELIFADEPTGNLDPETSKSIARLLRKINELGTTVLIATHDQEIMKDHADQRKISMENGSLIFDSAKKSSKTPASKATDKKDETGNETKKETKKKSDEIKETKTEESRNTIEVGDKNDELPIKTEKKSFWGSIFKSKAKNTNQENDEPTEKVDDKKAKNKDLKSDEKKAATSDKNKTEDTQKEKPKKQEK